MKINEIFTSIDGEVCGISAQGGLTTFIRFAVSFWGLSKNKSYKIVGNGL